MGASKEIEYKFPKSSKVKQQSLLALALQTVRRDVRSLRLSEPDGFLVDVS